MYSDTEGRPLDLVADHGLPVSTSYIGQNTGAQEILAIDAAESPDPKSERGFYRIAPGEVWELTTPVAGGSWIWSPNGPSRFVFEAA